MEISFNAGEDRSHVVAQHLGGRLGRPTVFNNGSRIYLPACSDEGLPDLSSYISAINLYGIILFTCGALAVLTTLYLYLDTLRHVMSHASSCVKTHTAFVVSVYPVVGLATYCAAVVPRAQLLAEAVAQGMFMFAMYQLFCLVVAYCGGEAELIRKVKPDSLNPRVAPCCCWPCCVLPLLSVNKRNMMLLRMLVLQLPVVQGLVYMVLLVMWAEEESLYQVNYMYLQPVVVASIFLGVWGMVMSIRMLRQVLLGHALQGKFLALQLVLLASKLQGLAAKVLVWGGLVPCQPPITPPVLANLMYNSLMLLEMLLLGYWARHLYKKPLPEAVSSPCQVQPVQVCQLQTVCGQMGLSADTNGHQDVNGAPINNNTVEFDNKNSVEIPL